MAWKHLDLLIALLIKVEKININKSLNYTLSLLIKQKIKTHILSKTKTNKTHIPSKKIKLTLFL